MFEEMNRKELFDLIVGGSDDWEEDRMIAALNRLEALEREACALLVETCEVPVRSSVACEEQNRSDRIEFAAAIRERGKG